MATNKEVLTRLRMIILAQIKECDGKFMPYVCKMVETEKGKNTIVQYCTNLVAQGDYTIARALMEKERELNPNLMRD
jgi:hypothetical protein